MVGALSIVRFRTAVKEQEELLLLLSPSRLAWVWGPRQRWPTAIGVALLLGYMAAAVCCWNRKRQDSNLYLNVFRRKKPGASLFERVQYLSAWEHVKTAEFPPPRQPRRHLAVDVLH